MSESAHVQPVPDPGPLPARPRAGHKGTFGTVLVVGGCDMAQARSVMVGAPALTANAALRSGCGLVKLAVPDSVVRPCLALAPCATAVSLPQTSSGSPAPSASADAIDRAVGAAGVSAMAVGPGWGVAYEQQQILIRLLADDTVPIVVDADGLSNLAAIQDFVPDIRAPLVITPHPGEYRRLAQSLSLEVEYAADDHSRLACAVALAQRLGCLVVLKGARTVVSDGLRSWVSEYSSPILATAGTGDVLTGIVASLAAQYFKAHWGSVAPQERAGRDLFDLAVWGIRIHAQAAQCWSDAHDGADCGLLASDLVDLIPMAMTRLGCRDVPD
ncbi:MAG: NAD(P)H-hydrate dehydratase [Planctomycetes bacterium]|nr:NAD(P)H-hydrate dehydratase [Planctomycetota bacterium]